MVELTELSVGCETVRVVDVVVSSVTVLDKDGNFPSVVSMFTADIEDNTVVVDSEVEGLEVAVDIILGFVMPVTQYF